MARRLERSVRRVAGAIAVTPGAQHRSITEGCSATSGESSTPTDTQNAPSLLAA